MTSREAEHVLRPLREFNGSPFELFKISAAASMCGFNEKTLRARIRRGELPAYGKPWRVRMEDIFVAYDPQGKRCR